MVLLLAVLALGTWFVTRPGDEQVAAEPLGPDSTSQPARGSSSEEIAGTDRPRVMEESVPRSDRSGEGVPPKFYGRGSIRGLVTVHKGGPLPKSFTVHIGPSTSLFGRELAETRSEVFSSAEFVFEDLPLGGYDVWVDARAMNSPRNPVLLTQTASNPYLVLRISPTGFIDGFVVNLDGRAAQDLPVSLEAMFTEQRLETTTRADGFYIFDDVPDGEYRITFGPRQAPLVPTRELVFQAPSMRFPRVELPPAVDILIHSTDAQGKPTGDVTVTGFGKPEGRIETVTDFGGLGWARNLPPGRYRVAARNEQGLTAKTTLEVKNEPGQEYWIAVR